MAEATFIVIFSVLGLVSAEIPNFVSICKRTVPDMNKCIMNSIKELQPRFEKGIPELDIPPMEPLIIPELVISRGGLFKALGRNIIIRGASKFEVKDLKADINNLIFQINVFIPSLVFDATYDVDAKILNINLKGKGPLKANMTGINAYLYLKGKKIPKDGRTDVLYDKLDLNIKLNDYYIQLENLFNGDKALNEAVNNFINENKKEFKNVLKAGTEKMVANFLLDITKRITQHYTYEELFPEE